MIFNQSSIDIDVTTGNGCRPAIGVIYSRIVWMAAMKILVTILTQTTLCLTRLFLQLSSTWTAEDVLPHSPSIQPPVLALTSDAQVKRPIAYLSTSGVTVSPTVSVLKMRMAVKTPHVLTTTSVGHPASACTLTKCVMVGRSVLNVMMRDCVILLVLYNVSVKA